MKPQPSLGSGSLRVEFITELSQLPPLAQKWEELNRGRSDEEAPFFQSYAWIHHIARIRSRASADHYSLLIATVWRDTNLIGIWPLAINRAAGVRTARNLDDPFGQIAGVVFHDASDIAAGVAAIIEELRVHADALQIEAVLVGSPLHAALISCEAKVADKLQAVFVDLRPYATHKEFSQSVNAKTRKNLRNLGNRMRREHVVEHIVATTKSSHLAETLKETFEARVQWLHRNGRTSPAFRDDAFRTVVNELPEAEGLDLVAFALATDKGTPVSAQWGFSYAGKYYAYMSAMNPDFDGFSPGRLHLGMVIEACFERGLKVLELMPPASGYKLEWNGEIRELETLVMSFSAAGHIASQLTNWMMPAARRLSHALPESLRKSLVRRFNRN